MNYFELIRPSNLALHHYNVNVQPAAKQPAPTGKKLSQIIMLLLELSQFDGCRDNLVTDFNSTLFSRRSG